MNELELKAKTFAKFWHTGQKRKYTGTPYWMHPGAVAHIVKGVEHTPEMVAAAWLHDVLEDTDATEEEVRNTFGDVVTSLVLDLTDVSKPEDGNRATRKALDREHTKAASVQAKTIKLADLIDNSRSILKYDPDFARVYLREKRRLLDEALMEGDQTLWIMADEIVKGSLRG